ncbi:MAG: glutamate racemase [Bacteroidetes bacterium]|nr:glutamate racemase [Bacteroidota bacterium]
MQKIISPDNIRTASDPIGIFDSGIGGLTVLHQALRELPGENFIYYADTLHVPYGEKPKEEVLGYIADGVSFLDRIGIKALVLACNTATSIAANELRSRYDFPIIGMEPAVKPAVERTKNKRVLVLATPLTLQEQKFKDLVAKVDNEKIVDFIALPELVESAEKFQFDPDIILPLLRKKLAHLQPEVYGTVVLGCTHFPFFRKALIEIFSPFADIIDGNEGTVKHLKNILQTKNLLSTGGKGQVSYYDSGVPVTDTSRFKKYLTLLDEMGK